MDSALSKLPLRTTCRLLFQSSAARGHCTLPPQSPHLSFNLHRTRSFRRKSLPSSQIQQLNPTQKRTILTWIRTNTAKARKESPILFPTLLVAAVISLTALGVVTVNEYLNEAPKYAAYPPKVEQHLRRAIRYSEIQYKPEKAFQSFVEALTTAETSGMDRFSDEVLGIHIRTTQLLEKAGKAKAAIEILERLSADCLAWISEYDQNTSQAPRDKKLSTSNTSDPERETTVEKADDRRARLFHKAIQCRVKAAELYKGDYIQDINAAKNMLSDTFGLVLKESQRNGTDVPRGMTKSETAAIADQLGFLELLAMQPQLAAPLFLYALNNLRQDESRPSCKQVMTMSTLAVSLGTTTNAPTRLLEDAKQWAEKALEVAAHIKPPERDIECDKACLNALWNLGEFARKSGDLDEAKKRHAEAVSLARSLGINEVATAFEERRP